MIPRRIGPRVAINRKREYCPDIPDGEYNQILPETSISTMIYLDHNSTTPLAPEAAQAMAAWFIERFGNPASQHGVGRRERRSIEDAREGIGRILGIDHQGRQPDRVIFTSGGTEANNLALLGITGCLDGVSEPGEVVVSAIEHPSVSAPAERLERLGWHVKRLPVDSAGVMRVDCLDEYISERTRLVSVMLANNETGVLQPVREIAEFCRLRDIPIHSDAVQVAGKLPLDFQSLGVDAMTVAAHKFHGPLGIGALIVRQKLKVSPLLLGGFQQEGLRGGTEAVGLAVGMHAALATWAANHERRTQHLRSLRDRFEARLLAAEAGAIQIIGNRTLRLPNTSCIAFQDCDRQALVMALDLAGVACSTGSACASGSSEPSPVLRAMGCDPQLIASAVRFSLGATTNTDEIDAAVARIHHACQELRAARHARRTNART